MDSKEAGLKVGNLWNDILIVNWFDKEWFEETYEINLTEEHYRRIVEQYNHSNICDMITEEIEDWIRINNIITKTLLE